MKKRATNLIMLLTILSFNSVPLVSAVTVDSERAPLAETTRAIETSADLFESSTELPENSVAAKTELSPSNEAEESTGEVSKSREVGESMGELPPSNEVEESTGELSKSREIEGSATELSKSREVEESTTELPPSSEVEVSTRKLSPSNEGEESTTELSKSSEVEESSDMVLEARSEPTIEKLTDVSDSRVEGSESEGGMEAAKSDSTDLTTFDGWDQNTIVNKDENFSNGFKKYVEGIDPKDNLMAKTGSVTKVTEGEYLPLTTKSITFSVTHYHGFQEERGTVERGQDVLGPYDFKGPSKDMREIEETPLNFSDYLITGGLSKDDFKMDSSAIKIQRGEKIKDYKIFDKIETSAGTRGWMSVYRQTDKITLQFKEKLKPGLTFSITPQATWVTTEGQVTYAPQSTYYQYNPAMTNSRVHFDSVEFKTTPLEPKLIASQSDKDTKFEVGEKPNSAVDRYIPNEKLGQTLDNLKKQYGFQIQQSAENEDFGEPVDLDQFIEENNKQLPEGFKYDLLFSEDGDFSKGHLREFKNTSYLGWADIYNQESLTDEMKGIYPALVVTDEYGQVSDDYRMAEGNELKPWSYDTTPPEYEQDNNPVPENGNQVITIGYPLAPENGSLSLVNDFHKQRVAIFDVRAFDSHDRDDLIYHIIPSGGNEISYGKDIADNEMKEKEKFNIPVTKDGYYEFDSYLTDLSGNKSKRISWKVTIGEPKKAPELSLQNPSLTYTVDMKENATIAMPDDGQKSLLKLTNAKTSGYKLNVKRFDKAEQDALFPADKLTIKIGEQEQAITSDSLEFLKLSEELDETVEVELADKLFFKDLTTSELVAINHGQNTVSLLWELVTDDSKIATAESL